ncbi:DUF2469 family protein [Rothia sp. P7208]|uniref:DUF2469 family protein n=1 Tax=Rothia sp. P7208 TaxID=3402660 RepID=UPI003AC6134D
MSAEDLEKYETQAQLALYEEYQKVYELFRYVVETDRRFYLANSVEVTPHIQQGSVYFEVTMNDVWVWDFFRASRFVKNVHVYSFKDVNVEERLADAELVVPQIPGFGEG